MNYSITRFLLSVEMTACYVTEERGLGAASTPPSPSLHNTLDTTSFRTAPSGEKSILFYQITKD